MTLCCLFLLCLIVISSASWSDSSLSFSSSSSSSSSAEIDQSSFPRLILPSLSISSLYDEQRLRRSSIEKRSQRNANILYRYCRRSGQAPQFCLKYAVRMIMATGH